MLARGVAMLDCNKVFEDLVKANFHRGGLDCLRIFRVKKDFFSALRSEVNTLIEQNNPSNISDEDHVSHAMTKPHGKNFHFSLINASGRMDDASDDYNGSVMNKHFNHSDKYPNLATFIEAFPHCTYMKIAALGPQSHLYPHDSQLIFNSSKGRALLVRFHLPIITNERAEMLLDNNYYRFEAGSIFFFNHGCIHSAYNYGKEYRYHLTWEMLLTKETFEIIFPSADNASPFFLEKVSGNDQIIIPHRTGIVKDFSILRRRMNIYRKLKLRYFLISPYIFHNLCDSIGYFRHKVRAKITLSDIQ